MRSRKSKAMRSALSFVFKSDCLYSFVLRVYFYLIPSFIFPPQFNFVFCCILGVILLRGSWVTGFMSIIFRL